MHPWMLWSSLATFRISRVNISLALRLKDVTPNIIKAPLNCELQKYHFTKVCLFALGLKAIRIKRFKNELLKWLNWMKLAKSASFVNMTCSKEAHAVICVGGYSEIIFVLENATSKRPYGQSKWHYGLFGWGGNLTKIKISSVLLLNIVCMSTVDQLTNSHQKQQWFSASQKPLSRTLTYTTYLDLFRCWRNTVASKNK